MNEFFNAYEYPAFAIAASAMCMEHGTIIDYSMVKRPPVLSKNIISSISSAMVEHLKFDDIVELSMQDSTDENHQRIMDKLPLHTRKSVAMVLDSMYEHDQTLKG